MDAACESPVLATLLRAAALLAGDAVPWPWLADVAAARHTEWAARPQAADDLRRRLQERGWLAAGPAPHVVGLTPAAAAARAALPDGGDPALPGLLRDVVGRRLSQFQEYRRRLFQQVVKGRAGAAAQDGWYVAPAHEVQAVADALGTVSVTHQADGSFVLALKGDAAWEEEPLRAFVRRQFAGPEPDALAWALRTGELTADDLAAAHDRITALHARHPGGRAEARLLGLYLLEQARVNCARGYDRSAWDGAGRAAAVFQELHDRFPDDREVVALLEEARRAQWTYDW